MSSSNVTSTQIVAGVAVVMALLGGAYAVGRATADAPPTSPAALVEPAPQVDRDAATLTQSAPAPAAPVTPPAREAVRVAQAPVQQAPVERRREPVRSPAVVADTCSSCAVVTSVRTEQREGEATALGTLGGAVIGGLLGNQVGGGSGKKIATVGGAVAGGYAGREIEKRQRATTVWIIEARERDGRLRRFERSADPGLRSGDEIVLTENGFTRR
jgi:outer membrane lipoprotein SlyB